MDGAGEIINNRDIMIGSVGVEELCILSQKDL